jgi:hypothetical protein
MVEALDHRYVLHTRRIHVTRYNVVRVGYILYRVTCICLVFKTSMMRCFYHKAETVTFFRTSNYVQQRKTYTTKASMVHLNCYTVITVT